MQVKPRPDKVFKIRIPLIWFSLTIHFRNVYPTKNGEMSNLFFGFEWRRKKSKGPLRQAKKPQQPIQNRQPWWSYVLLMCLFAYFAIFSKLHETDSDHRSRY